MTIHWKDTEMMLCPEKAIFLPQSSTLLVADTHLGKSEHFRKNGIGIPLGSSDETLVRLDQVIQRYDVKQVYFLGDLFHSSVNEAWTSFLTWMDGRPEQEFVLIQGNHDILPSYLYDRSRLQVVPRLMLENLILTHEPERPSDAHTLNIHGHIHPGYTLRGKGRQRLTLPCYHWRAQQLTLPAFGAFTGLAPITQEKEDQIFVVTETSVIRAHP